MPYFKLIVTVSLLTIFGFGVVLYTSSRNDTLAIDSAYERAVECADNSDYDCALENVNTVLNLQPSHIEASQLLVKVKAQRIAALEEKTSMTIRSCVSNMDLICAESSLEKLKKTVPESSLIPTFEKKLKQIQVEIELSKLIPEAYNCLDAEELSKDGIQCAQRYLNSAQEIAPNDPSAIELQEKLNGLTENQD